MLKTATRSGVFNIAKLDLYYRDCVIGGPGSFVIPIRDRSEFITATREKLLLEISELAPSKPPIRPVGPSGRILRAGFKAKQAAPLRTAKFDCLIGEKLWLQLLKNLVVKP